MTMFAWLFEVSFQMMPISIKSVISKIVKLILLMMKQAANAKRI